MPVELRLATESWLDGCLSEGAAAAVAAAEAGIADRALATGLQRIAADEQRHADLAWDIVAWSVSAGGAPVRSALEEAARACGPSTAPADTDSAGTAGLERWGCLGTSAAVQVATVHAQAARQRLTHLLAG